MITQIVAAGDEKLGVVNLLESKDDYEDLARFIRSNPRLSVDTETSDLLIYSPGHKLRLLQIGNARESWVIPMEDGEHHGIIAAALRNIPVMVMHNASFDLQVIERHLGIPMATMWPRVIDTKILAHLVDPVGREEGGTGHGLGDLVGKHISEAAATDIKGSMTRLARDLRTTKSNVFSVVPLDHPLYVMYAGADTILTSRVYDAIRPLVPTPRLVPYEHDIARICAEYEKTGFLLDVGYTEELEARLLEQQERAEEIAERLGCENVNSTEQVADVLEQRGVRIRGRTPTGRRKVDKALLDGLAESGDEFAKAVITAKKAGKWRKTWVSTFLRTRDAGDRCHPSINPLRARTARMSITGIPAQTLPSGDPLIRNCFIADEGHVVVAVDYKAQELRVLAALSKDPTMIRAFARGDDLHQITADAAGVPRPVGKTTNFAYVYGSGAGNIATQCGIPFPLAKRVIAAFESSYPRVKQYSQELQRQAADHGYVVTPVGRVLPVDRARPYSALNYVVQSASRDITCQGLQRLDAAGLTPFIRLPVHDEVIASVPAEHAERAADKIASIMADRMGPVEISTESTVAGRAWGDKYATP